MHKNLAASIRRRKSDNKAPLPQLQPKQGAEKTKKNSHFSRRKTGDIRGGGVH